MPRKKGNVTESSDKTKPFSDKLEVRKTTEGYLFYKGETYVGGIAGEKITDADVRERARKIEQKHGL